MAVVQISALRAHKELKVTATTVLAASVARKNSLTNQSTSKFKQSISSSSESTLGPYGRAVLCFCFSHVRWLSTWFGVIALANSGQHTTRIAQRSPCGGSGWSSLWSTSSLVVSSGQAERPLWLSISLWISSRWESQMCVAAEKRSMQSFLISQMLQASRKDTRASIITRFTTRFALSSNTSHRWPLSRLRARPRLSSKCTWLGISLDFSRSNQTWRLLTSQLEFDVNIFFFPKREFRIYWKFSVQDSAFNEKSMNNSRGNKDAIICFLFCAIY